MKPIKNCGHNTNGGSCDTKKDQNTQLCVPCVFLEWTRWENKHEHEAKNKKEKIEFLQHSIIRLRWKMEECRRRIEKTGCNQKKKKDAIKNVKLAVEIETKKINNKIKLLLTSIRRSIRYSKKNLISP